MSLKKSILTTAVSSALLLAASVNAAEIGGVEITGSGFATLGVGTMLNKQDGTASGYKRPFFAADYAQNAIYESNGQLQWQPDSKIGYQGVAKLPGSNFSVTGQVVARGSRNGEAAVEWLYGSYKINDNYTIQAGRKRIPMFYYSDTQDIGLALPWTHLPSPLYGWQAVNYNGVNLSYQGDWGDWSAAANILAGAEGKNDTGYSKIYYGKHSKTNIKWDNILGGDLTLAKDWFETRFVYLQSNMREKNTTGYWNPSTGAYGDTPDFTADSGYTSPAYRQQIYGVAFNVDYNNWLVRSEVIHIQHDSNFGCHDQAQILGVGYRLGKWTPMATVANYRCLATAGNSPDDMEAMRLHSLTLRYDLSTSSAIKLQYDYQKDRGGKNFVFDSAGAVSTNRYGDARLVTVTYDVVF